MSTAIAIPGNTADTFPVHFFGGGLSDDRVVVERFRPARTETSFPSTPRRPGANARRKSRRVIATDESYIDRNTSNQVLVELAMEALDRREWPGSETESRVARASLFAAQALARGLIADGRENEVPSVVMRQHCH